MRGGWAQLLVIIIALGAPAISWAIGKLRERYEVKKVRDTARRQQDEALRTTQLTERRREPPPEVKREVARQDLAARRQAQLRELRERQYQRGQASRGRSPGPVVARGPSARAPQMPQGPGRPPQPRPSGPLRPGVPASAGRRPPPPAPVPVRRPAGRPIQTIPARRPMSGPVPIRTRRAEPPKPREPREARRDAIAATQIGTGRAETLLNRPSRGVGPQVRGMLLRADGRPRPRTDIARAIALTEVLGSPMASRRREELPWNRVI